MSVKKRGTKKMNKVEMTLREVYGSVLLDIYNNAVESIKLVDEDELKKELVVNYLKTLNIFLFNWRLGK